MVVKVTHEQLAILLGEYRVPATSHYFNGAWTEKFTEGKITLSIKQGKRRKLVPGKIVWVWSESDQNSSGYNILKFKPNNPDKLTPIVTI